MCGREAPMFKSRCLYCIGKKDSSPQEEESSTSAAPEVIEETAYCGGCGDDLKLSPEELLIFEDGKWYCECCYDVCGHHEPIRYNWMAEKVWTYGFISVASFGESDEDKPHPDFPGCGNKGRDFDSLGWTKYCPDCMSSYRQSNTARSSSATRKRKREERAPEIEKEANHQIPAFET